MGNCKIAFVGDIMCGDSFYAVGHGVASGIQKYGSDFLPGEIVDCFSAHDLVMGNIESPISYIGRKDLPTGKLIQGTRGHIDLGEPRSPTARGAELEDQLLRLAPAVFIPCHINISSLPWSPTTGAGSGKVRGYPCELP